MTSEIKTFFCEGKYFRNAYCLKCIHAWSGSTSFLLIGKSTNFLIGQLLIRDVSQLIRQLFTYCPSLLILTMQRLHVTQKEHQSQLFCGKINEKLTEVSELGQQTFFWTWQLKLGTFSKFMMPRKKDETGLSFQRPPNPHRDEMTGWLGIMLYSRIINTLPSGRYLTT